MTVLKMGTRGSPLALAQSAWTARELERRHPGLKVETTVIKTTGDRFGAPPPEQARLLPQGAKGLWVKEIEEALLDGRVDFAVHSAKDLPSRLAPGLEVAAYPEREDPRDAVITLDGEGWSGLGAGALVATSSLRRRLLLSAAKPGLSFAPARGNVDTRLRKLAEGECDALVLAVAGLKRLGRGDAAHEPLDVSLSIPAPGQGALALQARCGAREIAALLGVLEHAETRLCVEIERFFLELVGGGCGAPVAAYARVAGAQGEFQGFFAHEGAAAGKSVGGSFAAGGPHEEFVRAMAVQALAR